MEGACWNQPPTGCGAGWCPVILMYAPTTGVWNVVGGVCESFDYSCSCTYNGLIPFYAGWGTPEPESCTAVIDPDDLIKEWDESNNEVTIPLFPNAVDESAERLSWSTIKALYRR